MRGDPNRDIEAVARRELTRLVDAIVVEDNSAFEGSASADGAEPSKSWRRPLLAAAAALVVAGTGAAVALHDDEPEVVASDSEAEGACPEQVATEGVLADGRLNPREILAEGEITPETPYPSRIVARGEEAGREWLYAVDESPPFEQQLFVDGKLAAASSETDSYPMGAASAGLLAWSLVELEPGVLLLRGTLPVEAAEVEVHSAEGQDVRLCPVAVPGQNLYEYTAAVVPAGFTDADITAYDENGRAVARGRVDRGPTDGAGSYELNVWVVPTEGLSTTTVPVGAVRFGLLPSGPWSLVVRPDQGGVAIDVGLPGDAEGASINARGDWVDMARDDPWNVQAVDGRLFIWGVVPDDVTVIWVRTVDDTWTPIPAVDPGVPGFSGRVFAQPLAEGMLIDEVTANDDAGTEHFRAVDVEDTVARLHEFAEDLQAGLAVEESDS